MAFHISMCLACMPIKRNVSLKHSSNGLGEMDENMESFMMSLCSDPAVPVLLLSWTWSSAAKLTVTNLGVKQDCNFKLDKIDSFIKAFITLVQYPEPNPHYYFKFLSISFML